MTKIHGRSQAISLNNELMLFNLAKYLLLICIPVFSSLALNLVEGRASEQTPYPRDLLHLEFVEIKKLTDGRVRQVFKIYPPTGIALEDLSILFSENQQTQFYRCQVKNNTFSIHANEPSHIRLFVISKTIENVHVVHTDLTLFGKSKTPVERSPALVSDMELLRRLPHIILLSAKSYYWHQTGNPLSFIIKNNLPGPVPGLTVIENNVAKPIKMPIKTIDESQPLFVYTPPHDEYLKQSGTTAARQDIIFTRIMDGQTQYHLVYALQVHRSRHAHDNHFYGFAVLGAGLLVFTGLVLNKRRNRPWWNE